MQTNHINVSTKLKKHDFVILETSHITVDWSEIIVSIILERYSLTMTLPEVAIRRYSC